MAAGGGGSWKVAYADFVTAMMAFFLVMWITAQDQKIKDAIAHSFNAPFQIMRKDPPNLVPREALGIVPSRTLQQDPFSTAGKYESPSAVEVELLRQLNENLLKALNSNPAMEDGNSVKLELTGYGLNITVFDRVQKAVFDHDTARLTEYGQWLFSTLAWEIARYKNFSLELGGHTIADYQPSDPHVDKWDLSTDRANAARHVLVTHGVNTEQVSKVSGYADTEPLPDTSPSGEANNRVTIQLAVNPHLRLGGVKNP
jgi:chemotaxis protein MotB